jgi:hypothetical protein
MNNPDYSTGPLRDTPVGHWRQVFNNHRWPVGLPLSSFCHFVYTAINKLCLNSKED